MDKNTRSTINEIKNMMDNRLTLESVFFSEDNDENFGQEEQDYPEESFEDEEVKNSSNFEETVNAIRKTALDGVTAFSQDPSSQEYDFFKKIWNMCDKIVAPKQKNVEGQ